MSEKYSFECVKFYTSCFFLSQVATGHFVVSDHFFWGNGRRVSMLYDPINDIWLKQCLKEKISKFMERKERNAEEKTSACQITSFMKIFLLFGSSTKIMSEKYSFECVKFYTSCFFLSQVATGHFVDLTYDFYIKL
jgi:hypothetical protein